MKDVIPRFMVVVVMIIITALLTGLVFTMIDDNKATYKEASAHIDTLQNKEKNIEEITWRCPNCGFENARYDLKCISCGRKNPWHKD